jgi:hypothetical protein
MDIFEAEIPLDTFRVAMLAREAVRFVLKMLVVEREFEA